MSEYLAHTAETGQEKDESQLGANVVMASPEEVAARRVEANGAGFEEARATELRAARDAVEAIMVGEKVEQPFQLVEGIPQSEYTPMDSSHDVVGEAEAILAAQRAAEAGEPASAAREKMSLRELVQHTHTRVQEALQTVSRVETQVGAGLQTAHDALTWLNKHLDTVPTNVPFGSQIKTITGIARQAEGIVGGIRTAVRQGSEALRTPLEMVERITRTPEADPELRTIVSVSAQELRAAEPSLTEDEFSSLGASLAELRSLQDRERALDTVHNALRWVQSLQQKRQAAGEKSSGMRALDKLETSLSLYRSISRR